MQVITFTNEALAHLSGEDKRTARIAVTRDGSLRGWHLTSSATLLIWIVHDDRTLVGLASEAEDMSAGSVTAAA